MRCLSVFSLACGGLLLASCAWFAPKSVPQPPAPKPVTLAQTAWVVFAITGVAEVVPPKPTVRWDGSERISGTGGCNAFTAQTQRQGQSLRLLALKPSGVPCLPLPGGQEDQFFRALEQTRSFHLQRDQLILEDAAGSVLLRLLPARPEDSMP